MLVWQGVLFMVAPWDGVGCVCRLLTRAPMRRSPGETPDHSERGCLHSKATVDWERRAKDAEQLVRESAQRFPITRIFFLPAFVLSCALGRKTFLTASEHRVIREAGVAVGDRDGLQKPASRITWKLGPRGLP